MQKVSAWKLHFIARLIFVQDPKSALDTLIEIGFDRLLTSGQEPTAIEGKETIRNLVLQSQWQD